MKNNNNRFTWLLSIGIGVSILLSLSQLFLSNQLASFGSRLATLEKEERLLSFTNDLLAKEIATASSIATIAEKAKALSFTAPTQFLVVAEPEQVALVR